MKYAFLLALLLSPLLLLAQQQASIHQVFEVKNTNKLIVKVDESQHSLHIRETYSSVVVVEIILQSNTLSQKELAEIVNSNRYQLLPQQQKTTLLLNQSQDSPQSIGEYQENLRVTYNISVPEYIEF